MRKRLTCAPRSPPIPPSPPASATPWGDLEKVQAAARDLYLPYRQLEASAGGGSTLYSYAKAIVRAAKERAKPVAERRPGYSDAAMAQMSRRLAEVTPIDQGLEELYLTHWMLKTREYLTVDNAEVKAMLGKDAPRCHRRPGRHWHQARRPRRTRALAGHDAG